MMHFEYKISGGDFTLAGKASSEIKKVLKQLGVNPKVIKRTVIALYEAEVNIVAHADSGTLKVDIGPEMILAVLEDRGPGIPDIPLAMTQGFSTASKSVREMGFGAGMGLPNIKANVDDFTIESEVGKGTTLVLKNYIT
jgi:anti-sigma regulatory factor (Ser/Thr protein kinase)